MSMQEQPLKQPPISDAFRYSERLLVGVAASNVISTLFSFALDPDGFKEHCKNMTDKQREFAKLQFESSLEVLSKNKGL